MVEMQPFDRITWNPNQMNGWPCIRGMRLTVRRVVEAVALYSDRGDLFRNYPELEPDDVRQALAFAAANLEDSAAESRAAPSGSASQMATRRTSGLASQTRRSYSE
jgi:uncharacterized protein (DUF433 family)